jgi:LPS-assembly protein
VMRGTRTPHTTCGSLRQNPCLMRASGRIALPCVQIASDNPLRAAVQSLVIVAFAFVAVFAFANSAYADDPSIRNATGGNSRSFQGQPGGMFGSPQQVNKAAPLYLQGDELIYDSKGSRVVAKGNVEIYYNNFVLTADKVTYDQSAGKLLLEGNTQIKDANGNVERAERIETTDDFRDAFIESLSVVTKDQTRIAARRAIRRDGNVTEFEEGKFTPCKSEPGKAPLWCISGKRIIHDQQAATLTYQDAQFEVLGVPVLFLPYFQHPDPSVKRRSGVLAPTFGHSANLGATVEVPYYFALSPSYDFTFHPEFTTKQGVLWKGDWRQRLAGGQYTIKGAGIYQDADKLPSGTTDAAALQGWRGTVETTGQFSLSSWWSFGWDATYQSDQSFRRFYGFDSVFQTDRVNTAYLRGMNDRNYFNASLYEFGGRSLNDTASTATASSLVHPVIDYRYIANTPVFGGELSFNGHARSMTRYTGAAERTAGIGGTDSTHGVTEVNWRRKIIDGIGQTWTPFASVRGDVYNFADARGASGAPLPSDTLTYGSLTAGMTYSYPFVAHTASASHVVAPTVQVVTRQQSKIDQRLVPNEDAKSIIFDDGLLFDVRKTSGYDLSDTGTRVNAGAQYTFQSNSGLSGRAVLGQSFHVGGNNIFANPGTDLTSSATVLPITATAFSPSSGLETARSDYVAGLYLSPLKNFSFVAQARFDDKDLSVRRQDTLISTGFGPVSLQAMYTYQHSDPLLNIKTDQHDLLGTVGLKLTNNWSILGQMRYDLDSKQRIQDMLQLRYADECFVLTASYQETFVTNTALNIQPDKTVMLRFELKNLGDFKYKTDATSFLSRGDNQPATPN